MPFMVIYRTSDGSSCYEQAEAIDEAALFVEQLRNKEGIDEIRIYRMEEISFGFRPYYKVELGLAERQSTPPPPPGAPGPVDVVEGTATETEEVASAEAEPPPAEAEVAVAKPAAGVTEVRTESILPAPPRPDGDPAGANGRRGIFGR